MKTAPSTKPTYRPVLRLPPLPDDQYEGLRNNIAINGVLVPIITDGGSPVRLVINGNQRKRLADEFGYPCPEVVRPDLDPEEMRTLAGSAASCWANAALPVRARSGARCPLDPQQD
jgi:hypothetical protein